MALEQLFVKKLTKTDIKHRLSFPTRKLGILPPVGREHGNSVLFPVTCGGRVYIFRCVKRRGPHIKPVIQSGWSTVVREKGLQVGDFMEFYVEAIDHQQQARYSIEVRRCVPTHSDQMGTTYDWHRII